MSAGPTDAPGWAEVVRSGSRTGLARAITLVESTRPDHVALAQDLLTQLLPYAGGSHRVGLTGVPGVGKSTLVDELGTRLTSAGHRVAVLAVDPSSQRTGGSILGDKTRMVRLSADPHAFVRPSPTSGTLGGVARATRESIVVLEAAGFDVVLVETVGVGQSEVAVAAMVDTFCVLTLARTGDHLQAMKKGVLELADVLGVNKADGAHREEAERAARELRGALRLIYPPGSAWAPPVVPVSGLTGAGVDELWGQIRRHREEMTVSGAFEARRRDQRVEWMWSMVRDHVVDRLLHDPRVVALRTDLERSVRAGEVPSSAAARQVLAALGH